MTQKRAVMRFSGSLEQGFQIVLEIQIEQVSVTEVVGALPGTDEIIQCLANWETAYGRWLKNARIKVKSIEKQLCPPAPLSLCKANKARLDQAMQRWLAQSGFKPVEQRLRDYFSLDEAAPLLIRCDDLRLHRLPWSVWEFVQTFRQSEVVFSCAQEQVKSAPSLAPKVEVLAVFGGESEDLDLATDLQALMTLPDAEVTSLEQPSRSQLGQALGLPLKILFFAGHSYSQRESGVLQLNRGKHLKLNELRYDLRRAIANGLTLAIFNSCDGLGLAYDLASLRLPYLIVMGQPVPDPVAHAFLDHFLTAFQAGKPIHLALREAREQLQRQEDDYPGASDLPVLFQNPAIASLYWQDLFLQPQISLNRRPSWFRIAGLSAAATLLAMGGRYGGLLQPYELALYDSWLRSRPSEPVDERITIVEIDDRSILADVTKPEGRSISDDKLSQVLQQLEQYQPKLIGLDIYREQDTNSSLLQQQFVQNERLYGICKTEGQDTAEILPPPDLPDERVGFSDVRGDRDRVPRIQILSAGVDVEVSEGEAGTASAPPRSCPRAYSIAALLATDYLYDAGIELSFSASGDRWQWGDTAVTRLGASRWGWPSRFAHVGPFAGIDVQGHQILLNYRARDGDVGHQSPANAFQRISVDDLLQTNPADRAQLAEQLADKIVLIGVTADDSRDRWLTPYRTQEGRPFEMPGVYLQAQMTSQVISAVLDGRRLLWCLPLWADGLVVWGGAVGGLVLTHRRSPGLKTVFLLSIVVIFYAGAVSSFRGIALYLPFLPGVLAMSTAMVTNCFWKPSQALEMQRIKPGG